MLNQSVDEFVDSFWPAPDENLVKLRADHAKWFEYLNDTFGVQIVEEYSNLLIAFKDAPSEISVRNLCKFLYENALGDEFSPDIARRGRQTLRSILGLLCPLEKHFTLIDLGCGDGRITLGAALYLKNLRQAYAIDTLDSALDCLEDRKNKSTLEFESSGKIRGIKADYLRQEDQEKLYALEHGFDVVLLSHPFLGIDKTLPPAAKLVKPDGRVIVAREYDKKSVEPVTEETPNTIVQGYNEHAAPQGVHFKLYDSRSWNDLVLLVAVGQKASS